VARGTVRRGVAGFLGEHRGHLEPGEPGDPPDQQCHRPGRQQQARRQRVNAELPVGGVGEQHRVEQHCDRDLRDQQDAEQVAVEVDPPHSQHRDRQPAHQGA
jgi:hypothetical protein